MTPVPRRLLLAAPALLLGRAAVAATLLPGRAGALTVAFEGGRSVFRGEGIDAAITLPASTARIALVLPIAGRDIAGIAFPTDASGALELLALVGWDNTRLRILGLEVLHWKAADGALLSSRFSGVGDRTQLRVPRDAAIPRRGLPPRWENWTDLLAWRDGAPLADAPVRPPLAGTMQARLRELRRRCTALLDPPLLDLTADMLASLDLPAALE